MKNFDEEYGDEKKYCCCGREYCSQGKQEYEIIEPLRCFLLFYTPSLLSAFAEEVIQGIDTQNEYLLQEAHKKCTTNDFSNGAFWAHKTMQKILSDQRLKVKEILEVIK